MKEITKLISSGALLILLFLPNLNNLIIILIWLIVTATALKQPKKAMRPSGKETWLTIVSIICLVFFFYVRWIHSSEVKWLAGRIGLSSRVFILIVGIILAFFSVPILLSLYYSLIRKISEPNIQFVFAKECTIVVSAKEKIILLIDYSGVAEPPNPMK